MFFFASLWLFAHLVLNQSSISVCEGNDMVKAAFAAHRSYA